MSLWDELFGGAFYPRMRPICPSELDELRALARMQAAQLTPEESRQVMEAQLRQLRDRRGQSGEACFAEAIINNRKETAYQGGK